MLVATFVAADGPVVLGGDDTLERRGGRRIGGRGCYRDGVRSTGRHTVRCFGLKWVSLMVLVGLPWSRRVWALPFLTVLCPASSESGRRSKRAWIGCVRCYCKPGAGCRVVGWCWSWMEPMRRCRWLGRAKSRASAWCRGYGGMPVCFIGQRPGGPASADRRRKKERGNAPCALGRPGAIPRGRPKRWRGMAASPRTRRLFSRTALWHRNGQKPLPIRFVIVRDPQGQQPDAVFFSTEVDAEPQQIVEWAVMRWAVETTFQECRTHLGLETQRQWSEKAIQRTTPCLLGLFSIVCWLTEKMRQGTDIPLQTTAWYPKDTPTFSDCLYAVRQHLWKHIISQHSIPTKDQPLLPPQIMDLLATYPIQKAA